MPKKVGQQEFLNGLELWRRLFFENEGGATEAEVQERECFIHFPECPDPKYLAEYLNEWEALNQAHGTHLPDAHLQSMLKSMLPAGVRSELRKWCRDRPTCTVNDVTRYLRSDLAQGVDERVAQALRTRRFQDLPGFKGKINSLQVEPPPQPHEAERPARDDTNQLLQRVCATLEKLPQQLRGRGNDRRRPGSKPNSRPGSAKSSKPGTPRT